MTGVALLVEVTALANGQASVGARAYTTKYGSLLCCVVKDEAMVTVDQKADSVAVVPDEVVLGPPGSEVQLTLEVYDAGGSPIEDPPVTWSSGDEAVATVSATGVVTAVADGETTVSARVDEATGTSAVIVDKGRAALTAPYDGDGRR